MNIVEVNNISKRFDKLQAVDDISFSIEKGKVYGMLGPNGAGKTTTIRMIMNIIIPDSGSVSILGETDYRKISHRIGYLPEERGIYRKMKLNDVLLFLADLKEMKKKTAQVEIDMWLEKLGLAEWKKKKVEELSKGMQQKLQFIATVMPQPELLILDEPFLGLDPINTNLIKDIIMEEKKRGTTIIFSTHQMESAERLCDEIMLINRGKKILSGTVGEVKRQFGKKAIQLDYTGDNSFLNNSPFIADYNDFGNYVEIELLKDAIPHDFLESIVSKVKISRFEVMEPSLHDIFIKSVQGESKIGGKES
ncbi:MAG: ATP-binding cassette domain-containing protein [Candidatus Cloacimonetes bacterium]|nr:ATP-binding cassette domain-containing protein [Candidatus Cloacimonadota bacterium]